MVYYWKMILWTDFLALALVTLVVVLFPQLRRLEPEAPKFLRIPMKVLPYLLGILWASTVLLWASQ